MRSDVPNIKFRSRRTSDLVTLNCAIMKIMSKKKNEKILIIFAVVIMLAAGFYYLWQSGFFEDFFGKKFVSQKDEEQWRRGQELQVASLIKTGDIAKCADVDYESADGIEYSKVCQNNIALKKAQETLDIFWCKKLDGKLIGVENCERQILFSKLDKEKDISVCAIAPSSNLKTECENAYWIQKAVADTNISLCANLLTSDVNNMKEHCETNYYLEQLIKNPASADCAKFTSDNMKKDCELFQSSAVAKANDPQTAFINCQRLLNPRLEFACERLR